MRPSAWRQAQWHQCQGEARSGRSTQNGGNRPVCTTTASTWVQSSRQTTSGTNASTNAHQCPSPALRSSRACQHHHATTAIRHGTCHTGSWSPGGLHHAEHAAVSSSTSTSSSTRSSATSYMSRRPSITTSMVPSSSS